MALGWVEQLRDIFKLIKDDTVRKIILVGESGVGKTWMAKKLSAQAMRDDIYPITLWLFLCRNYDRRDLCESISRQLFSLSSSEDCEGEDYIEEVDDEEMLEEKIAETLEGKKFLLILDDEGSKMTEEQILPQLRKMLPLDQKDLYKILITRTNNLNSHILEGTVVEVKPLPMEESLLLLRERMKPRVHDFRNIQSIAEACIKRCRGLPSATILIAKALSYFGLHDHRVQTLKSNLEDTSDDEKCYVLQMICSGHDLFPVGVLADCCDRSGLIGGLECLHYNQLITYWILEGYLGHINSVKKAYQKGHQILMELIDCQLLRMLEAGYVMRCGPVLKLDYNRLNAFCGTASLGLASLFDDWREDFERITEKDRIIKALGKGENGRNLSALLLDGNHYCREVPINLLGSQQKLQVLALFNHTIKSLPSLVSNMQNLRVLVLRGCDFSEDIINCLQDLKKLNVLEISGDTLLKIPDDFFEGMFELRSLNLSGLQMVSLPSSLYNLRSLRWLVLRGCSCLEVLDSLKRLEHLVVLDLAAATSLRIIKDKAFSRQQKLKMFNLSKTKIKTLPLMSSCQDLTHIFLSGCKNLNRLRTIRNATSLQTLDLSGATEFREFHDLSLDDIVELKMLDLSRTLISILPHNISNPRHLYLKGCSRLEYLPRIDSLKDLKVLDLSCSTGLHEIAGGFFEHLTCLQVLNLSETNVEMLPSLSNLCNLRQLLLSRCACLVNLPELNPLTKLEVLDLSHCSALQEVKHDSFEPMFRLQTLDLSETKIECLPPLSKPSCIRCLSLKNCTNLKVLPPLITLREVEELNLSGVSVLRKTGAAFLEFMSTLRVLDLSETLLEELPSMSNLENLNYLSLRGCLHLETVPNLEELTKLEVLDLSGTGIRHLPCLDNFINLRQLLIRDCSSLEEFVGLEILDLLGANITELPYGISKLSRLEMLDLPNMKNTQEDDTEKVKFPLEELKRHQWVISSWPAEALLRSDKHSGVSVSSTKFLEFLNANPLLWETNFKQFHFLVQPIEAQNANGTKYFYRNELIFRDLYFQSIMFVHPRVRERSLEIRGFSSFPVGVELVLGHAEFVFLVDNPFIRWLSDLGSDIKEMNVCWIERCTEMESVLHVDNVEDTSESGEKVEETPNSGDNLLVIWLSNLPNLKSIYSKNLRGSSFRNLKCFHLDYCPKFSNLFPSSQLLENLEVLQIKFCDQLETLFENKSVTLPKLHALQLWALPKLETVGLALPSLRSLSIGQCPKLVNVVSSSLLLPEKLETLQIQSCSKLVTVFEIGVSANYILHELHSLDLLELPELKSIGAELPSLQDSFVRECPKLLNPPFANVHSANG